jgi:hypothetical protein
MHERHVDLGVVRRAAAKRRHAIFLIKRRELPISPVALRRRVSARHGNKIDDNKIVCTRPSLRPELINPAAEQNQNKTEKHARSGDSLTCINDVPVISQPKIGHRPAHVMIMLYQLRTEPAIRGTARQENNCEGENEHAGHAHAADDW